MYEIIQNRGENYIVNENHILTLNMPDHKIIFWNNDGWSVLYWDNINSCIKTKHIKAIINSVICEECGIKLNSNLKRHYSRKHKNSVFPEKIRKRILINNEFKINAIQAPPTEARLTHQVVKRFQLKKVK